MVPKKDCSVSVQLDRETKEKAKILARRSGRTLSGYVRQLLRGHIRECEALDGPIRTEG